MNAVGGLDKLETVQMKIDDIDRKREEGGEPVSKHHI